MCVLLENVITGQDSTKLDMNLLLESV